MGRSSHHGLRERTALELSMTAQHGSPMYLCEVETAANKCVKAPGLARSLGSSLHGRFVAPKQMVFSFHRQTA